MDRFFYKHFGDKVSRRIEKEYNRMLRREQYLSEREAEYRANNTDYDKILEVIADPATLPDTDSEQEKQEFYRTCLDYLPIALEMLKCNYPEWYALIYDHYLSDNRVSIKGLTRKYGLSRPMVKYRLQLAKDKLKEYIIMYKNK